MHNFPSYFFCSVSKRAMTLQIALKKAKDKLERIILASDNHGDHHCLLGWDGKSIQRDVLKGDLSSLKAGQGSESCSRGWQILLSCVQDFDRTHDKSFLHCGLWLCLKPHGFLSPAPADCRAKAVKLPHEPEVVRAYAPPSSDRLRERRVVASS